MPDSDGAESDLSPLDGAEPGGADSDVSETDGPALTSLEIPETWEPPPWKQTRRRRPAPRANFFWRFVFPLIVVAAGVAGYIIWEEGRVTVLRTTDTQVVEVLLEPAEPGYEAFVTPTPTLLLLHVENGGLTGVTFLAQTDLELGGGAVLLPADLLVYYDDAEGLEQAEFLSQAYNEAGADRVEFLAEQLFGYGFSEVIEITSAQLADSMRLVEPLPYLLTDDLVIRVGGSESVWLAADRLALGADTAARLYGFRNPDEAAANRVERQKALWESWLDSIDRADDLDRAVLPFNDGLSPFLRALGGGSRVVEAAPLQPALPSGDADDIFYLLGDEGTQWIAERAMEMVPRPITPGSFLRPTVRLLDGIGDRAVRDGLMDDIIAAGGIVTVIGNSDEFGVELTTVSYNRPESAQVAAPIAELFGVAASLVEVPDPVVDVTVTVGRDRAGMDQLGF